MITVTTIFPMSEGRKISDTWSLTKSIMSSLTKSTAMLHMQQVSEMLLIGFPYEIDLTMILRIWNCQF